MINKNWKREKEITAASAAEGFKNPPGEYNPYMFWFWIDQQPDPENYRSQAEEMSKKGMSPGYVHDRGFAGSYSEQYFKCFDAVLDEVKKAGLTIGYCEPATFLKHDKVRMGDSDLTAVSLKCKPREVKKGQFAAMPSAFFTVYARVDENGLIDSDTLALIDNGDDYTTYFRAEDGDYMIFPFYKFTGETVEGCRTNLITKKIGPRYSELVSKAFIERYKDDLGGALAGHFFDWEGDYGYKLCYSEDLEELYEKRFGESFKKNCALLLVRDKQEKWLKARYNWFDALSEAYSQFLFKYHSDELEAHGLTYTVHLWEERLLGQALLAGDPMRIYRSVSLPGIDHLGRDSRVARSYKEVQSVAELEGKRYMCEILGCAGWELDTAELKASINNALSLSVDHFVFHGAYSNREKITEARYAPDFYNWTPMWDYFKECTDYVRRGSYLVTKGKFSAGILLYNPLESVWALLGDGAFDDEKSYEGSWVYDRKNIENDFEFGREITQIDKKYVGAIDTLTDCGADFLIADRYYLEEMSLDEGKLCYKGHSFGTIILPPLKILTRKNAAKLVELAKNGGCVYSLGELPAASAEYGGSDPEMLRLMTELKAQPGFKEINGDLAEEIGKGSLAPSVDFLDGGFRIHRQKRVIGGHSFYFLANDSDAPHRCTMCLRGEHGRVYLWSLETGERKPLASADGADGSIIEYEFAVSEGFFLEVVPEETAYTEEKEILPHITLDGEWRIWYNAKNQPSEPTGFELPVPESIKNGITAGLADWAELGLGAFSGNIEYETEFELPGDVSAIELDLGEVRCMARVTIDGEKTAERLWAPFVYRFDEAFKGGGHTLHVTVGNTMINLLNPHRMDNGRDVWPTCHPDPEDYRSGLMGEVKIFYRERKEK